MTCKEDMGGEDDSELTAGDGFLGFATAVDYKKIWELHERKGEQISHILYPETERP